MIAGSPPLSSVQSGGVHDPLVFVILIVSSSALPAFASDWRPVREPRLYAEAAPALSYTLPEHRWAPPYRPRWCNQDCSPGDPPHYKQADARCMEAGR